MSTEFQFFPPNRSVARAEYGRPCEPYEYNNPGKIGFWSGFHYLQTELENVSGSSCGLPRCTHCLLIAANMEPNYQRYRTHILLLLRARILH